MSRANVPAKYRFRIFLLATTTACQFDSIVPVTIGDTTAMKVVHFGGQRPKWVDYMRTFGEAGVVTLVDN